jgi:restriction system protein
MPRKNQTILDLLVEAPWWVSVVVAGAAFLSLRYILPGIGGAYPGLNVIARAAPLAAPWLSFLLLLPAPISAYNSWRKRKLRVSRKGLDSTRPPADGKVKGSLEKPGGGKDTK